MDLFDRILHAEAVIRQLHPAGLDLAQVEDVVDQLEQVLAGRVNVLQALLPLLRREIDQVVLEDLAESEDGIERCAQLVAHVCQELALQTRDLGDLRIGDLDLALLRRDLAQLRTLRRVQPRVVDADGGLARDDPHQRLLDARERLHLAPGECQRTDEPLRRLEWHHQAGARRIRKAESLETPVLGGIRDGHELAPLRGPSHDALTELESGDLSEVVGEWKRRNRRKPQTVLVHEKDGRRIAVDEVGCGLEHEVDRLLQFQAGREEVSDLTQKVDNDLVVHRSAEYTREFRPRRIVA